MVNSRRPSLSAIQREIRESKNNPFYETNKTYSLFNGNVPKVTKKPFLADFGLPYDAEQIIEEEKRKQKHKAEILESVIALSFTILAVFIIYKISGEIAMALLFSITVFFFSLFIANSLIYKRPEKETETQIKYNQYLLAERAYSYWQDMRTLTYWDSLDGHQFEHEVASVFRGQGYNAVVTKGSGDGGVDVILTKNNERIAVQCKAHSNPVGPAVIRDLYGTMTSGGYTKAILVSKSGFTKGVYEFASGKPIELLSLNDILAMVKMQ